MKIFFIYLIPVIDMLFKRRHKLNTFDVPGIMFTGAAINSFAKSQWHTSIYRQVVNFDKVKEYILDKQSFTAVHQS